MVKQQGYQNMPLDGIWLRAPYLHNGSVPNLRELLEPVEKRTKSFYRGYDVYDPVNVGFVTSGPEAQRAGWRQDAAERGNGNQGHVYGIALSGDEKAALLEFMKTL
jgi:cytochrome c peroxidase